MGAKKKGSTAAPRPAVAAKHPEFFDWDPGTSNRRSSGVGTGLFSSSNKLHAVDVDEGPLGATLDDLSPITPELPSPSEHAVLTSAVAVQPQSQAQWRCQGSQLQHRQRQSHFARVHRLEALAATAEDSVEQHPQA